MKELIEAIKHDSLPGVRKILKVHKIDLNSVNITCDEYDVDDPDEIPLLFWIVQVGVSIEMIETLLEYGLDISWVNREGLGILDIAIKQNRFDIVGLCGEHGISYRVSRRRSGITPLMLAASFGNKKMVKFLVDNGAMVDGTDHRGTDAIEYARILGHTDLTEYIKSIKETQKEKQGK